MRFLGHPLHPALVHAPLGLLLSVIVWDVIGCWYAHDAMRTVAHWTLLIGLIAAVPAAITGVIDLIAIPPGRAQKIALYHMCVMMLAVIIYLVSYIMRRDAPPNSGLIIGIDAFGTFVLAFGGWLGGHLVYAHGVGIKRDDRSR